MDHRPPIPRSSHWLLLMVSTPLGTGELCRCYQLRREKPGMNWWVTVLDLMSITSIDDVRSIRKEVSMKPLGRIHPTGCQSDSNVPAVFPDEAGMVRPCFSSPQKFPSAGRQTWHTE